MKTMGERILNRRTELKMSQQDVADKVGVSRVAVTKWESGQTGNLKLDNLLKLCKLLNLSIEYLILGGELRTYGAPKDDHIHDQIDKEYGLSIEQMSLERTDAHKELDKVAEKDLIQVTKIIEAYNGTERRSKPRNKRQGNSNK